MVYFCEHIDMLRSIFARTRQLWILLLMEILRWFNFVTKTRRFLSIFPIFARTVSFWVSISFEWNICILLTKTSKWFIFLWQIDKKISILHSLQLQITALSFVCELFKTKTAHILVLILVTHWSVLPSILGRDVSVKFIFISTGKGSDIALS